MECGEVIYEKVSVSPRPPPTISFKVNWIKEFGPEVAGGSEGSQQTQPKTRNPIIKNGQTRRWIKIHPMLRVDAH